MVLARRANVNAIGVLVMLVIGLKKGGEDKTKTLVSR